MSAKPLHVLQFTDTHIFDDPRSTLGGVDTRASLCATLDTARAGVDPVDVILVTGDLAAEAQAGAYEWLVRQFEGFDAPVLCVPGNHDTDAAMNPIVAQAGWHCGGTHEYGGWRLVLLNSVVAGEEYGELGRPELAFLSASLEQHPEQPTLVVLHHHPVPLDSRWMDTMTVTDAALFWEVIDRHPQVRGVLWGHVHQNYDRFRGSVRLLATPSTCVQFAPRSVHFAIDRRGPGYRRLLLHRDGTIGTSVVRATAT